jgi:hypothetical protein
MVMGKWNPNKKFTARDDVVFTDLDDGSAVLLHLQTKYYYSLNETGCFLWKLLEGENGASEESLVKELCTAFDVEETRARNDVRDFLKDLDEQGLIK